MSNTQIVSQGTFGVVRPGRTGPVVTSMLVQTKPDNAVLLSTGEWVPTATFSTLSETEQAYLRKHGVDAFNREQSRVAEQRIAALEPHKAGEGYNLVAMVGAGHTEQGLRDLGFSQADITEAQTQHKALATMEPYKVGDGYDLVAAVKGKVDVGTLHTLFSEKAVIDAHQAVGREGRVIIATPAATELDPHVKITGGLITTPGAVVTPPKPTYQRAWDNIKASLVPTEETKANAAIYCQSWGITDKKVIDATAQWIEVSRAFLARPEADPRTDPKGYLIESGKALAAYAPVLWAVNWKDMTPRQRAISIAVDVVIIASLGLGKGLAAVRAKPVVKAAKAAGKAADRMDDALRVLAKTPVDDMAKFGQASSNAQKAIQASKVADAKFVATLEQTRALTASQLATLEKASGIKGLKRAITDVANAQRQLDKAWKAVPKTTLAMGDKKYVTAMTNVERAQARLNAALETFNAKLQPRFQVNQTPEFKGFATEWHKRTKLVLEGGEPVATPLGGTGKGKQLMVLEKTAPAVTTQTYYELKMKPVYKAAVEVARKVGAPAVKATSKAAAAAMAATAAAKVVGAAPIVSTMPATTIEQAAKQSHVSHEAVAVAETVPRAAAVSDVEVLHLSQAAVDVAVQSINKGMTAADIQSTVHEAVKVAAKAQAVPATQTQTRAITRAAIHEARKLQTRYGRAIRLPRPSASQTTKDKPERTRYPDGTIAWKQGRWWKIIPPPYDLDKPITADEPPAGVTRMTGSPQETLTFIGGKLPFGDVSFDLGVVDGHIDVKGKRIKFAGEGLRTNVGRRIQSRTKGVSLPGHASGAQSRRHGPVWVTRYPGDRQVALSRTKPGRRGRR